MTMSGNVSREAPKPEDISCRPGLVTAFQDMIEDEDGYVEYVPVAKRRLLQVRKTIDYKKKSVPVLKPEPKIAKPSLLAKANQLKNEHPEISPANQIINHEKEIIEDVFFQKPLIPVHELAKGITYKHPLLTGWKAPFKLRHMSKKSREAIRKHMHIVVDGEEIPPPINDFKYMRYPESILQILKAKKIMKPTPIQVQGMPIILSGRDMIGIASTGSGKTLAFVLPLIMIALQEETLMPILPGEGPVGLVLSPSRELAIQTFEVMEEFLKPLKEAGYAELRPLLCIGGSDMRPQVDAVKRQGAHIVVATPGRLKDMLKKKKMSLDNCRCVILDEADRMVGPLFEEDVREIFDHFRFQRQTVLFSATMPKKIRDFATSGLVNPVTVNVGRAGAANRDVIQEVEYVKDEAKFIYLVECLQKTPPPVLVFSENKADVDNIHEYLLFKGVGAVAIHGGKDQEERTNAISLFRSGKKDVLVATDVVSKGLDFPNIQHVINFDMPSEIENYVHRIGRTGRCGKTGIATTFINKNQTETTLLDLKHLLHEAKQRIPPVLAALNDPNIKDAHDLAIANGSGVIGCYRCGGLGHRVVDCPTMERDNRMQIASRGDVWGSRAGGGEM